MKWVDGSGRDGNGAAAPLTEINYGKSHRQRSLHKFYTNRNEKTHKLNCKMISDIFSTHNSEPKGWNFSKVPFWKVKICSPKVPFLMMVHIFDHETMPKCANINVSPEFPKICSSTNMGNGDGWGGGGPGCLKLFWKIILFGMHSLAIVFWIKTFDRQDMTRYVLFCNLIDRRELVVLIVVPRQPSDCQLSVLANKSNSRRKKKQSKNLEILS